MAEDIGKKVKIVEAEAVTEEKKLPRRNNRYTKKEGSNNPSNTSSKKNISTYTSKTEEIKDDIFTLGANMWKKWILS